MALFILKRIGLGLITLWILSVIVFFAAQVLPGDPARAILGPLAQQSAVDALSHQLGTDKSVIAQYFTWIGHILTGDLGTSYAQQAPIGPILGKALVNSLKLAAPGLRHRRPAGDHRRRRRRAQPGQVA